MSELEIAGILAGCLVGAGVFLLLIAVHLKIRIERFRRVRRAEESRELAVHADLRELVSRLHEASDGIERRVQVHIEELKRLLSETDAKIGHLRDEARGGGALASDGTPERSQGKPPQGEPAPPEAPGDRTTGASYEEIFRLKGQGLDPIEIARRVNMNVGEVELVLSLYPSAYGAEQP